MNLSRSHLLLPGLDLFFLQDQVWPSPPWSSLPCHPISTAYTGIGASLWRPTPSTEPVRNGYFGSSWFSI